MTLKVEGAPDERPGRSAAELGSQLLDFLRGHLDEPGIEFDGEPSLLAGGFHTTALRFKCSGAEAPFDRELVLRVYPQDDSSLIAYREAAFQNGMAEQGFPAPEIHVASMGGEIDGSQFVIMDFIAGSGPNLSARGLLRGPSLLAGTQLLLHEMDVEPVVRRLVESGHADPLLSVQRDLVRLDERIESDIEEMRPVVSWLIDNWRPVESPVVCHGDIHPFNLLTENRKLKSVLDWATARVCDRESDIASTITILGAAPVSAPRGLGPAFDLFIKWLIWNYRRNYEAGHKLDRERLGYFRVLRATEAIVRREPAFSGPKQRNVLRGAIQRVTGIEVGQGQRGGFDLKRA